MSKQIELLRKIQELAKRGVGGEAINAQNQLEILLKKYNLKLEDIEEEKKDYHFLNAKNFDLKLLRQIAARVNYNLNVVVLPPKKVKEFMVEGNCVIECTVAEFIEIEQMFHIYRKLYKKEEDIFYTAFLTANDLLARNPKGVEKEMTDEEYENWLRINKMSKSIENVTIRKQIESAKC